MNRRFKFKSKPKDKVRVNKAIRAQEVRLIGGGGEQLGVIPIQEAIAKALEAGYDLVEVAPQAAPPVCKIMDYGKYKYQQSKKQSSKRAVTVKEIKLRPRIGDNDLNLKIRKIRQFLDDGNKTKVTMLFRGREIVRHDLGLKVFDKLTETLPGNFSIEQKPQREGRNITMLLAPKSGGRSAKEKAKPKEIPAKDEEAKPAVTETKE